jgi:polyribonucleotide nucleotidyltransferase
MVTALTAEPVVGEVYEGTVKSTTAFGAFVEIMPGTEALLHISEMKHARVEKTEDVVQKGQTVRVKLIERDERGRLRLSMKALEPKPEGAPDGNGAGDGAESGDGERAPREPRGDRGDRPRGDRPRSGSRGGDRGDRGGER